MLPAGNSRTAKLVNNDKRDHLGSPCATLKTEKKKKKKKKIPITIPDAFGLTVLRFL